MGLSLVACGGPSDSEGDAEPAEGELREVTQLDGAAIAQAEALKVGAATNVALQARQTKAYRFAGRKGEAVHVIAQGPPDRTAQVTLLRVEGSHAVAVTAARATDGELAADLPEDADYIIDVRESKARRATFTLLAANVTPLPSECEDGLPSAATIIAATKAGEAPHARATSAPVTYVENGIGETVDSRQSVRLSRRSCHAVTGCSAWTSLTEDNTAPDAGNFVSVGFDVNAAAKLAVEITIKPSGDGRRIPWHQPATKALVDANGRAGFAAKYDYLQKTTRDLWGSYATESLVTRARVGKSCAVTAASKVTPDERGGYVELRATSRVELTTPLAPAPRVDSPDVPANAVQCGGERLTDATILAKFAPGTSALPLGRTEAIEHVRSCHPQTGCSEWRPNVDASTPGQLVVDAQGAIAYKNGTLTFPIRNGTLSVGEVRSEGVALAFPVEKVGNVEKRKSRCESFSQ